jgi:hypothetical protein
VLRLAVASEALDLFALAMNLVQLLGRNIMLAHTESVAVQANAMVNIANLLNLTLMAGAFATGIVIGKLLVVNLHKTTLDLLVRRIVAFEALSLNQLGLAFCSLDKVAGKTNVPVNLEMLVALETAVARSAGYLYAPNFMTNMLLMAELGATEFERLGRQFIRLMTFRPQTRYIQNHRIRFRPNPANDTIDRLSKTVDFAFNMPHQTGLQMAIKATNMTVRRSLPAIVVGVHNVARVAKTGLFGNYDHTGRENNNNRNNQENLGLKM